MPLESLAGARMLSPDLLIPTFLMIAATITLFASAEDSESLRMQVSQRIFGISDTTGVQVRLASLGLGGQYEIFRMKQVTRALVVCAATLLFLLGLDKNMGVACIISLLFSFLSYLYSDRQLTSEVRKNRLVIESEFASIVEMLTLSLSAGETPLGALDRVSNRSNGRFARELSLVVEQVRAGKSFQNSLDEMGRKIDSSAIRRFVDAVITAMMRGAPLVEVLHRHCAEARQIQRNIMMEKAGKAEISMMIPVVFLILPISVLFALWPSLTHLNLFSS